MDKIQPFVHIPALEAAFKRPHASMSRFRASDTNDAPLL